MNFPYESRNTAAGENEGRVREDRWLTHAVPFDGNRENSMNSLCRAWQLLWRHMVKVPNFKAYLAVTAMLAAWPMYALDSESANVPATPSAAAKSVTNAVSHAAEGVIDTNDISTNGMDALNDEYRLAVGDTISYQVVEDQDDVKTLVGLQLLECC